MIQIIAEVGSCWRSIDDCMLSISLAKQSGADAVKFQHFTSAELYGFDEPFVKSGIPSEWLPKLAEKAKACGIEFMCSAFSEAGVDRVDPYVKRHKIAASEATWLPFLAHVAGKGKPVVITLGHLSQSQQKASLSALAASPEVITLYGEPEYPCRDYNLNCMLEMASASVLKFGLSDHSTSTYALAIEAARLGATIVEKHVQFVDGHFADTCVSISGDQFAKLVRAVKHGDKHVHAERFDYVHKYARRLVAITDIAANEELKNGENYGAFRLLSPDTSGLPPWSDVDGRRAGKSIERGSAIGPTDISP